VEIVRDISHALCKEDIGLLSLVSSTADKDLLHEVSSIVNMTMTWWKVAKRELYVERCWTMREQREINE